MLIDDEITKLETESAEMLKVGAVEPAEEKQQLADWLKELKIMRTENMLFKKHISKAFELSKIFRQEDYE